MGPRFPLQRLVWCALFLVAANQSLLAQSTYTGRCRVTSNPFQVRAEGVTERLGDVILQCSGGTPGSVLNGNLILFLPVTVTNRIDSNNQTRDAMISVDTGNGFAPSAFAGLVSGNSISFNGISFPSAGGNLALKVSGIRGNASQFARGTQQPIIASVSSSLPLDQAQVIVAYPQPGLTATLYSTGITCYGSPGASTPSMTNFFAVGTAFASTRFTEGFASAFETRQTGTDNGVRFLVKYSGFPSNAHLYVPDAVAGSDALVPTAGGDLGVKQAVGQYVPGSNTLVLVRVSGADSSGAGGFAVYPPQGSGPQTLDSVSEVMLTSGAGYVVYEVADANMSIQETAQFPTFIALPKVTSPAIAAEAVSLAPVSGPVTASSTAPIVRFVPGNPSPDCNALGDCDAPYFPKLMVDATNIQISAIANGGIMTSAPGYIPIRNSSGGSLAWNAVISYQTGSGWLFVDYSSGIGNGSVRVWSDTKNLAAGTYQATVTINAGSAGSQTIPLTLTVSPAPPPPPPPTNPAGVTVSMVVNAATFGATPVVPGSLATVMGSHFSGKNVAVTFDGIPATILFSGESQINLQVPLALANKTTSSLVVTVDGSSSAPFTVTLASAWPAVFAHGVLNQNGTPNDANDPASPGDILQIFITGIPKDAVVSAQIGDQKNLVPVYAGDAPGVTGVQQVNVAVPPSTAAASSLVICATPAGGQQFCSPGYQLVLR